MKIYHYTNLESLALILKNKTIRFNRLDKVDDLEEGNAESWGVRFCKYVFVSCWTENPDESIPLWKMYSGDFGGVRIAVKREMFKEYRVSDLDFGALNSSGFINTKIPSHDLYNPNFIFSPISDYNNDFFYRRITYVDDVSQYTKDAIQTNNVKDDGEDMRVQMKRFGSYKNKRWAFQDETRFVLYILPCNPLIEGANSENSSIVMQNIRDNKPLPFTYYDMSLKDEAVDSMEITLSPSTTEAQKVIIQTLVERHAPKAQILNSELGELVRLK